MKEAASLKPNSIKLAGSELIRSWFEVKFHYAIWFEPASNQLRTSSEPDNVMEFGFCRLCLARLGEQPKLGAVWWNMRLADALVIPPYGSMGV